MTVWFLAFLAVAWVVVYLPSVWRARQRSPLPAVQRFKRRMRLISPRASAGRWVVVPESKERLARDAFVRAQQRRRRVLGGLVVLAAGTGLWALASGGTAVEVHLIVDAFVAFYIALVLDHKRKRIERGVKIRTLPRAEPVPRHLESEPVFEMLEVGGRHS